MSTAAGTPTIPAPGGGAGSTGSLSTIVPPDLVPLTATRLLAVIGTAAGRRNALLLVAVLVLAAVARLYQLGSPDQLVFDESYYARDACFYLGWDEATCEVQSEVSRVHPPLGKWLIALGILFLGYDPIGWRVSAAVAGVLTVGLLYVLTRRLTGSSLAAVVAAGVLALDPLSIVSSRVAMLDVFVTAAGVATVLFAVLDRDALAASGGKPGRLWRPWRAAAGLAGGCAVAAKWSGALVLLAVVVLVLLWEADAARRAGRRPGSGLLSAAPSVLLWLVATPTAVYVASYAGRLDADLLAVPWHVGAWIREFVYRQLLMARFHAGLDDTHPYASPAWSWLLGKRAVVYFFEVDPAGRYREVLAFANPLLWVPGLVAAAAAALSALRRRVLWGPEVVVAAAVGAAYLPWLVLTAGRPFVFLYYVLPTVPFLALALGWSVTRLPRTAGQGLAAVVGAVAVAVVMFWEPLIYARPLDYNSWRDRIVFADCTPAERTEGRLAPRPDGGPPPPGWCWV
jgi:dolichyl-phosphate-mannose--protein O-mannosyl transferase